MAKKESLVEDEFDKGTLHVCMDISHVCMDISQ
jgi:hypothetical protein